MLHMLCQPLYGKQRLTMIVSVHLDNSRKQKSKKQKFAHEGIERGKLIRAWKELIRLSQTSCSDYLPPVHIEHGVNF